MPDSLYLTILTGPLVPVPAPKPLMDALTSAEVYISDSGQSGCRLTFTLSNNSSLQTFFLVGSGAAIPFVRVVLVATLGAMPQVLLDGVVTQQRISPEASRGRSTLTITCTDLTALMDQVDYTGKNFSGQDSKAFVENILAKYGVFGITANVTPAYIPDNTYPGKMVPTQVGTDLGQINQLAEEAGYVFYMDPGPVPGQSSAYWGPRIKIGVPQPALNVNMDAWTNVESLNFRYEPQDTLHPLVFVQDLATMQNRLVPIPSASPISASLGSVMPKAQRVKHLNCTAKLPPEQALMRGIAASTNDEDATTGEGTLDVVRYGQILNARELVGVRGAGSAFDGIHYVRDTTHQIKLGEYKQTFTLTRNGIVSNVPTVPVSPF
jgi:hypothetical protein